MFCKNCGKEIDSDSKFCPSCGNPIQKVENPQTKEAEVSQTKPSEGGTIVWEQGGKAGQVVPGLLSKRHWRYILFGFACYIIRISFFDSESFISTILNALGAIAITGGIVIYFRKPKSK